jgi:hypothetical protein
VRTIPCSARNSDFFARNREIHHRNREFIRFVQHPLRLGVTRRPLLRRSSNLIINAVAFSIIRSQLHRRIGNILYVCACNVNGIYPPFLTFDSRCCHRPRRAGEMIYLILLCLMQARRRNTRLSAGSEELSTRAFLRSKPDRRANRSSPKCCPCDGNRLLEHQPAACNHACAICSLAKCCADRNRYRLKISFVGFSKPYVLYRT